MPSSHLPLFRSRLDAGEALYLSHPLGPREPADTLLIVASDGAVEVAYPWAYLGGLPTLRVSPAGPDSHLHACAGRALVLVDDGLLAPDALERVLRRLRELGPRMLAVVAPALRSATRQACQRAGVHDLRSLRPPGDADGARCFYAQQPVRRSVASGLLQEICEDRRPSAPVLRAVG